MVMVNAVGYDLPHMGEPAFRIDRAQKRYAGTEGVGPIDLVIEEGSTTVLLGTSGAGKSTLLKLLNGLVVPDRGQVLFRGQPLSEKSHLQMGYVVQGGGLFPHLTAAGNVALVARWLDWDKGRIDARMRELAALVRLPFESLSRYPVQLSGGQSQRVGLMRALMLDAQVLLLDEPLGALDPLTRFDLQQDLREVFQRLGKTVVIVTHDLSEAAFFGGTVLLFEAGQVVQRGTIDELMHEPATPFVARFVQAQRGVA
jgi:osmoprotectant transport system ATP-binding protein